MKRERGVGRETERERKGLGERGVEGVRDTERGVKREGWRETQKEGQEERERGGWRVRDRGVKREREVERERDTHEKGV